MMSFYSKTSLNFDHLAHSLAKMLFSSHLPSDYSSDYSLAMFHAVSVPVVMDFSVKAIVLSFDSSTRMT